MNIVKITLDALALLGNAFWFVLLARIIVTGCRRWDLAERFGGWVHAGWMLGSMKSSLTINRRAHD